MTQPTQPPTPAAVIAARQARYDAAVELQQAINGTHELASAGRPSEPVRLRQQEAERVWDERYSQGRAR